MSGINTVRLTGLTRREILNKVLTFVPDEDKPLISTYFDEFSTHGNDHSFQVINAYTELRYNQLDRYLKLMLPSTHVCWYCFMDDSDFLEEYQEFIDNENQVLQIAEEMPSEEESSIFRLVFDRLKTNIQSYNE